MNEFFLGPKNNIGNNQGTSSFNRFFKSKNPGVGGDYNTYKFENRFTFKTIGDTERFHNSQSHHDVFTSFRNRNFVDQNHVANYQYKSFFGTGAEVNGETLNLVEWLVELDSFLLILMVILHIHQIII